MNGSGRKPPRGDWDAIVEDLETGTVEERGEPLPDGEADEKLELVDRPSAVENENLYAYKSSAPEFGSPPEPEPKRGLKLPLAEVSSRTRPEKPVSHSTRLPDAVPRALFDAPEQRSDSGPPTSSVVVPRQSAPSGGGVSSSLIPIFFVGGGILVLLAGIVFLLSNRPPPPPPPGTVSVLSEPEGAAVLIDGQPTGHNTPAQLSELEPGRVLSISVSKPGFVAEPENEVLEVVSGNTLSAVFALSPVRRLAVETDPPGADVMLDGRTVPGVTPLTLPPLRVGQQVTVEIDMAGYLPKSLDVTVEPQSSTVEPQILQEAVDLTVITEPASATVKQGDRELGMTPLYDAPVPKNERISIRIEKPGYRSVYKRLKLRHDETLEFALKEVPLRALRLRGKDRAEARRLDRAIGLATQNALRARKALTRAERNLERLLDDPRSMFGARAKAEATVDRALRAVAAAEDALVVARSEAERFRARVLAERALVEP